jgi:predicted metal-dependent hydrolase
MRVEVVRSPRRKKTVQASVVAGVLRLRIPSSMSQAEEEHWVDVMRERIERQLRSDDVDLAARGRELANQLDLSVPKRITFSDRQRQRWGSCTPETGSVRISSRAASFPGWVLDYIIVHELAHLDVPDHSPAFWQLVRRYPLAERARGFLIAKNLEEN